MSDYSSDSDMVEVEAEEEDEEEEQHDEDLGVVCEVCATGLARKVLVLCKNYGPDHRIGCHTFCMAGDRWQTAGLKLDYFCTACSEFNKLWSKAQRDMKEQRALQGGGVAHRKGKPLEEMPALPPIHAPVRARHAAAVTMQPTAQMKIDRAAAAAAEGTSEPANPAAAAAAAGRAAAAAAPARAEQRVAAAGRGGGKALAGRGQPFKGRGLGAIEPPKLRGPLRQQQQQQQQHKEQPRTAATAFVKGLNQGKPGEVKAVQRSNKAAAERAQQEQQQRERERQKKEATAAAIAAGRRARQQQQTLSADTDAEYTVTIGQLVQISCQIVQAGVRATDDEAELHIMLDLKGHLKLCHPMEALASEQQRHIFRDEMIPELQTPNPGEERKQLVGGVFDLELHPSISRYADCAEQSYKPLKFVPVQNARISVQAPNGWMDDWVDFYRERRLRHQLQLLGDKRLSQLGDKLMDNLDVFFEDVRGSIKPSVLHGDLWSGNIAGVEGQPSIFDPATYYGHHEAEFGMSWCAGFTGDFWRAYHELIPKAPLFDKRKELYLLYHYLNHTNLFGGGYYNTSLRMMERLVDQI